MLKRMFVIVTTILIAGQSVGAYEPYINYTYSSDNRPYIEPQAYVPEEVIRGRAIGAGDFRDPSDVFVSESGRVYIVDSGNNRIVILGSDFALKQIIDGFVSEIGDETFNTPRGIFVDSDDNFYVADTENKRIVKLDDSGKLLKIFSEPVKALDIVKFEYKPVRLSVDNAGRLFIVSMNINHGMIELDSEGNFVSFFGATRVRANFAELIWRRLLTQEQIDTGILSLPTEYSSNDIDENGFVFGTISATGVGGGYGSQSIRKLNPTGMDILRRMGFSDPVGDTNVIYRDGSLLTSKLADVCVGEYGMYSVLDLQRGRIFTYDYDGNLLYVFGSIGNTEGSFTFPKAQSFLIFSLFSNIKLRNWPKISHNSSP
ncbi:gluconolactonase, partial [Candidatus Nomurabacteria bacterium]|nr:gluconolactonase [Candidatus Nomurabacteria bacterium]